MVMDEHDVRIRLARMKPFFESARASFFAANEAMSMGHGGVEMVYVATGLARRTINRGMAKLRCDWHEIEGAIRRSANRKRIVNLGNVAPYGVYDMDGDEKSDEVVLPFKRSNK